MNARERQGIRAVAARSLSDATFRRVGRLERSVRSGFGLGSLERTAAATRTDKTGLHFYTQHYARHLRALRLRKFVLIEIGVLEGASLEMWSRWFPRATIVGLDIEDKSVLAHGRVHIRQGDQSDPDFLRGVVAEFGRPLVVIDDGSHINEHQQRSFETLFPLLVPGGRYAIEDTQTSYWPDWGGSLNVDAPDTTMAMVKSMLDGLNHEEFLDDYDATEWDRTVTGVHAYHNLVVIDKGNNLEGSNKFEATSGTIGQ